VSSSSEGAAGVEKEAVLQVVTAATAPAFEVTELKEGVAHETVVPLTISEMEES
jgi:hypothetical protein